MRATKGFSNALLTAAVLTAVFAQWGCANVSEGSNSENAANMEAVRAVLNAQTEAWNRGDVEGFMDGYAREDSTTFLSGGTRTDGWRTVLERYRNAYDTREKMGTLQFTELELKPLSPFYIMATGRWQLARAGDTPNGRFTLIFRRTAAGWRIVHDHTSSSDTN
ncbi:MAG TPA: DUF4440 domain-containing protein [Pyrinomonadaceae bacterium]|nr:DUF4440 domain-containing protein [Pyrinomonadaceae bacterium]